MDPCWLVGQLAAARAQHEAELASGAGWVELPAAFGRKSPPSRPRLAWSWVAPAHRIHHHAPSGQRRRHHLHETVVQKAVRAATRRTGIAKRVICHTLRHSFATHLLQNEIDIRTMQTLLGHQSVETTMICKHVVDRGPLGVISPLNRLAGARPAPKRGRSEGAADEHGPRSQG